VGLSPADALSNAANAAIGTYAAGTPLFYADMETLVQRLGELRLLSEDSRASIDSNGKAIIPSTPAEETLPTTGTWVSGFGSGMHIMTRPAAPTIKGLVCRSCTEVHPVLELF
jgi:hypothetical protein